MYCGHAIPESIRLSKEEARSLLKDKYEKEKADRELTRKESEGEWGYRKYRESGGYDDDERIDLHWRIGGDD